MLKLIKCEFLKLKRKKFIPLIILAAFLFPRIKVTFRNGVEIEQTVDQPKRRKFI